MGGHFINPPSNWGGYFTNSYQEKYPGSYKMSYGYANAFAAGMHSFSSGAVLGPSRALSLAFIGSLNTCTPGTLL